MRERHRKEWTALSSGYRAAKTQILKVAREGRLAVIKSVTDQFRPSFGEMVRRHGIEAREFKAREVRFTGKLENAIAVLSRRQDLDPRTSRGFVADAFNYLTSRKAREDGLSKLHAFEMRRLAAEQNKSIQAAVGRISSTRRDQLARERIVFSAAREALIAGQGADKAKSREAWGARNDEAARAFDRLEREARSKAALLQQTDDTPGERIKDAYAKAAAETAEAAFRRAARSRLRGHPEKDGGDKER